MTQSNVLEGLVSDAELNGALEAGRFDDVVAQSRARTAVNEADARAWFFLGVAQLGLGETQAACESLEKACALAPDAVPPQVAAGAAYVQSGRNAEARTHLERALSLSPDDKPALYHKGRLEVIDRNWMHAVAALGRLREMGEDSADIQFLMGLSLRGNGDYRLARQHLERALQGGKDDPATRLAIAICHLGEENSALAMGQIDDLLASLPDDPEVLFDLATDCQEQGSIFAAQPFYTALLDKHPEHSKACVNYSSLLTYLGRSMEALYYLKQSLEYDPDNAEVLFRIGVVQHHVMNDKAEAKLSYEAALKVDPHHSNALTYLAGIVKDEGKTEEANDLLRRAVEFERTDLQAYLNLAHALRDEEGDEALQVLEKAKALPIAKTEDGALRILQTRASVLLRSGDISAALRAYREVLLSKPKDAGAHSGMLFCLNYDSSTSNAERARAYKEFDKFVAWMRPPKQRHVNTPDPERKLKIGYISGDFRGHSVGFFAEPILSAHSHEKFEIYCYSNMLSIDAVTRRMMPFADHWRWVNDLSDDAVAEMIRMDGIDILVDLSNHTAYNRLMTLARKPAPIQMTWIGMPTTTGMSAIDYRITDARMDPVGMTESLHSEKLLRLPSSGWCYRPTEEAIDIPVGPLPALANGHLTFASFNAFGKINRQVVELWARMFKEIPNAILYMATGGKDDDEAKRALVRDTFESWGFPVDRLRLFGRKEFKQYFEFHNQIDIALDPFPYNGGTVTAHALWMGVPVLTLAGQAPIQRMAVSMNTSVGIPEFIAQTPDEYIAIAKRYADDFSALAHTRKKMRQRMQLSPLMDSMRVVSELENGYREAWREWCAKVRRGE